MHTAWHLPLLFIPGVPQARTSFSIFTLGVVSIAIVDTALYLRHRANLLLAILIHLLANVCGGVAKDAGALTIFFIAEGVAAALAVAVGGVERRRDHEPPRLKRHARRTGRRAGGPAQHPRRGV